MNSRNSFHPHAPLRPYSRRQILLAVVGTGALVWAADVATLRFGTATPIAIRALAHVVFDSAVIGGFGLWIATGYGDIVRALHDEKELLDQIVTDTSVGVLAVDRELRYTAWNPAMERLSGMLADEVIGRRANDVFPFLEQVGELHALKSTLEGRMVDTPLRTYTIPETGREGRFEGHYAPLRNIDREVIGVVGLIRDVTDREQRELALAHALAWQEAIVEGSSDAIFVSDVNGRFALVNEAASTLTGYGRAELLTMHISDLHDEQDLAAYRQHHDRVLAGESIVDEAKILRKDGTKVDTEFNNRRVIIDGVTYLHTVARDVTARKQNQAALARVSRAYRTLVESSPIGIFRTTIDGRFMTANNALVKMLGFDSVNDLMDMWLANLYRNPAAGAAAIASLATELETVDVEREWRRRDGTPIRVRLRKHTVRDQTGNPTFIDGFVIDVTAEHEATSQLRDSEARLRALSGQLIATQEAERSRIARELHDEIGQALTAVRLQLRASARGRSMETMRRHIANAVEIVDDAVEDVRDLMHNLRPRVLDDLGLAEAIRSHVDRLGGAAGPKITLETRELGFRPPAALESACFRIAQEALTNAMRHAGAKRIWIRVAAEGDHLVLVVRDDGEGFDVVESGPGFGLDSMRERATLAGGTLTIESGLTGTTVRASFPLTEATDA